MSETKYYIVKDIPSNTWIITQVLPDGSESFIGCTICENCDLEVANRVRLATEYTIGLCGKCQREEKINQILK